jgi:hypothetical protein
MASRMLPSPRMARYSGSERPAWRMNQTGVRDVGRLRQAARNGGSSEGSEAPAGGGAAEGGSGSATAATYRRV